MDGSSWKRQFGKLLKERRLEAAKENKALFRQDSTAALITTRLKERNSQLGCSDSSLCQYEGGIGAPKPEVLDVMAELYKTSRLELLYPLFLAEYAEYLLDSQDEKMTEVFWKYLKAGAQKFSDAELSGADQLRSLTTFANDHQLLDLAGQIAWQASLLDASPKLECFWLAQGDFKDDAEFYDVARTNIAAGVKYVYFLRQEHLGRFKTYKARLANDIGADAVRDYVLGVPFDDRENIVTLDFLVANPDEGEKAIGFCRIHSGFHYNIRLPYTVLRQRIEQLEKYVVDGRDKPKLSREQLYAEKKRKNEKKPVNFRKVYKKKRH